MFCCDTQNQSLSVFSNKDFQEHDKAYGTTSARQKFVDIVRQTGFKKTMCIDDINYMTVHIVKDSLQTEFTRENALTTVTHLVRDDAKLQNERDLLIDKALEAYDFNEFCSRLENTELHKKRSYYNISDLNFVSKRCKLGILYTIAQGKTIHFVFNPTFNFDSCFNKEPIALNNKRETKSITSSELRFIYRNWHEMAPLNQIRFWYITTTGIIEQKAPWEGNPAIVKQYVSKNSKKYYSFFAQNRDKEKLALAKIENDIEQNTLSNHACTCTLI